MKPPLYPSSGFFLLVVILISINTPTTLCEDDNHYTNCSSNSFSCGNLSNLTYPFWGENRAEYCGQPNFQLKCEDGVPKLIVDSIIYRIIDLYFTAQNLTVARDDYWYKICPSVYQNNTFDPTVFQYFGNLLNVTLFYDCTSTSFNPMAQVQFLNQNCKRDDGTIVDVYYAGTTLYVDNCNSVTIPIFQSQGPTVVYNITGALDAGFGLQWRINNDQCNKCNSSGGECGYDTSKRQFSCFCKDGPHTTSCSDGSSVNSTGNKKAAKIGIAVGVAATVGILVGCWVYFMVQRRKKFAEQSKSKDHFVPPSSRGSATSTTMSSIRGSATSTTMSQSVPSYPLSKLDSVQRSFYFGVQVFNYAELEEATDNFHPSRELGDGGFGTVYYGNLKDGRVVAVKRLYESNFKRVQQFMNEVEILARLRHKNLVALYGCTSRHSRELLLVYEYIPNGTLADHLNGKGANSALLPWPIRLNIAVETAEALAHLHASDVIHRDVKSNNILLDNKFQVKVADFGLSRLFPNDVTHVSTAPQGTPGYVDPEYYQSYQLTDKSDVYSFGVVLVELISSLQAVDVNRHRQDVNLANMAINKIQNHALHELVDPYLGFQMDYAIRRMTTAVAELAFRCLQQERDMRPCMDEVLQVLRGIQNEQNGGQEVEIVDIKADDITLLKNVSSPRSPDSVTDKWAVVLRTI